MDYFTFESGEAFCEKVPLEKIAEEVGTPAYVYSLSTIRKHCEHIKEAFASYPTLSCFAVKANSNLSVLREIFSHGFGADVVSIGELGRALSAGVKPDQVCFSGVGKTRIEIARAMRIGILSFNIESAFNFVTQGSLIANYILFPITSLYTHVIAGTGMSTEHKIPQLLGIIIGVIASILAILFYFLI